MEAKAVKFRHGAIFCQGVTVGGPGPRMRVASHGVTLGSWQSARCPLSRAGRAVVSGLPGVLWRLQESPQPRQQDSLMTVV